MAFAVDADVEVAATAVAAATVVMKMSLPVIMLMRLVGCAWHLPSAQHRIRHHSAAPAAPAAPAPAAVNSVIHRHMPLLDLL